MQPKRPNRPTNRVHTFSRWSAKPEERITLAQVDLDFCEVMCQDGISPKEIKVLAGIAHYAANQKDTALREISNRRAH
jgi:hypothetical protein